MLKNIIILISSGMLGATGFAATAPTPAGSTTTITVATSAPAAPASGTVTAAKPAAPAATTIATTTTTATTTKAAPAPKSAAKVNTSTAKAPEKKPEPPPSASYSFTYGADYSLQSETQPDGSRSQGLSHTLRPGMAYGAYRGSVTFEYSQDLIDSQGDSWADPAFALSRRGWDLGSYFKLSPSAGLVLPMKESTRNDVGMQYNISGALGLSLNTKNLGMDAWSFGWQVQLSKNFTEFDTNAKTGAPNAANRLRNRFTMGYNISDAWSLFTLFDFNSNYSVNGVVTNSFFHLESIGYSINDVVSLSLSHANGGSFLKSVTYENNMKFYDKENSSYGLGVEVAL